nr:protein transport protein SEC23-like [Tanacetum cinerariifolium]
MVRRVGGVGLRFQNGGGVMSSGVSRFLLLTSEGAYVIHSLLEELGTDQWLVALAILGVLEQKALVRLYLKIYRIRWSAKVMSWIVLLLPLTSGTLEINCSKDIKIQ